MTWVAYSLVDRSNLTENDDECAVIFIVLVFMEMSESATQIVSRIYKIGYM